MARFQYKRGETPLDGYTIEHGLGIGGFGEVYYAVSDAGREVALKSLQNYEEIELRGIGHCMNLKSPHLVTIFDVKQNEAGDSFVIMEYVQGPSLRLLLDGAPEGLGPTKAAFFLREMAKGLSYLHEAGVVHRDLKPHNVFYEEGFVKIGDYSLCKSMSTSHRTGHTMTVGTVHYMAPEISEGRYDASVDIYALGVILYEMLTGVPPFTGGSMGEVLMKHLTAEPDLSAIDEPFRRTIARALAKNPADRFDCPAAMVESLFGAEHVQNSVVEFNPQELSVVADMAARKVAITPSGRAASSRPGGASWGKTWKPGGASDSKQSHQRRTYVAEPVLENTPGATPPPYTAPARPPANKPTPPPALASAVAPASPPVKPPGDDKTQTTRDALPLAAKIVLVAGVIAATSALTAAFPLAVIGSPIGLMACMTATILITARFIAPKLTVRPLDGRLAIVGPTLFTVVAYLQSVGYHHSSLVDTIVQPLGLVLPFGILDWTQLVARSRQKRLNAVAVAITGFGAYFLTGFWWNDVSPIAMGAFAAAVSMCVQILSPFSKSTGTSAHKAASESASDSSGTAATLASPVRGSQSETGQVANQFQSVANVLGVIFFGVSALLTLLSITSLLPGVSLIDYEAARILAVVGIGMLTASFGLTIAGGYPKPELPRLLASNGLLFIVQWQCLQANGMPSRFMVFMIPIAVGLYAYSLPLLRKKG